MPQIAGLAYGADGFGAFGGSSGSAHMRYKTGSHVDARGTAFNAGIAKKNANKSGTFTWGPFFETGHGNYDSYLDNGTHGSGSTSYTGGGVFARQESASGCYVEGALRLGKTKAENQLSKWYGGAALLYEFGGEARAHFQGYSLASPSSSGASVMLEGGWKYTPSATSPVELCSRRVKFAKLRRSKNANSGRLKFANLSQSKRANHKISTAQIGCSGYG